MLAYIGFLIGGWHDPEHHESVASTVGIIGSDAQTSPSLVTIYDAAVGR